MRPADGAIDWRSDSAALMRKKAAHDDDEADEWRTGVSCRPGV